MTALEPGTFKPLEVIMHPVPGGRQIEDASKLDYSEASIELTAEDRTFIQQRLRRSLDRYTRPVVEDTDVASTVPTMVRGLLTSSKDLIEHSRIFARDLYLKQKSRSPRWACDDGDRRACRRTVCSHREDGASGGHAG